MMNDPQFRERYREFLIHVQEFMKMHNVASVDAAMLFMILTGKFARLAKIPRDKTVLSVTTVYDWTETADANVHNISATIQ